MRLAGREIVCGDSPRLEPVFAVAHRRFETDVQATYMLGGYRGTINGHLFGCARPCVAL